jgi:hypothetical protein
MSINLRMLLEQSTRIGILLLTDKEPSMPMAATPPTTQE